MSQSNRTPFMARGSRSQPKVMGGVHNLSISYDTSTLSKIHVLPRKPTAQRRDPLIVVVKDREYETSPRFWNSIASRFSISDGMFRYFSHAEVFERVAKSVPNDKLALCIEESGSKNPTASKLPRLLAVGTAGKPSLMCDPVLELMRDHKGTEFDYHDGMLTARFQPVSGKDPIQIVGEDFVNSFQLEVPIDGYGRPKTYLELIKQVCMNGMIGYAQAFRSEINATGDNPLEVLDRALGGYDNDAGFAEMHNRIEASTHAWASVSEVMRLHKLLAGSTVKEVRSDLKPLSQLTGDLPVIYGMTNIDAIADKRQAILPTKAKVFDLITFATEVSTHKINHPQEKRMYDAYIGTLLTGQFDLEGSVDKTPTFEQFFTMEGPASAKEKKARRIA